jgi:hypothetical protein
MTNGAPPFKKNMAGGVEHLAESDIEAIRDLLRGYGSSRSILKELIQNAEDAGADRLDFFYLPADSTANHLLMRWPSLLVVNNGAFRVEHRYAIRQINLGTKGTDNRAIGRFGKGLKSVFAWCEAFFIIARTDRDLGWPETSIADLFNPWHGWRRANWGEEFERYPAAVTDRVEECASPIYPGEFPWLAFLFPLRSKRHKDDAEGETEWIHEKFPGDDAQFMADLAKEMRVLAPSLVNLRNLKHITISDMSSGSLSSLVWQRPDGSDRIPAPDEPEQETAVRGEALMKCQSNGETQYRYTGLAGLLPADSVAHLEQAQDWPKVVKRTPQGRSMAACKAKGRPHFATLITANAIEPNESQGSLDLRWSVFFPIGQQPGSPSLVRLAAIPRHITVNLHGFFFLDSERLRIDGLDNGFKPNGATSSSSCLEWNRIVATQGTLKCLPKAVADFAEREALNASQCRELAAAIRQTSVWKNFDEDVCRRDTWRPCWRAGEEVWELVSADVPILLIPEPLSPREILASLPALAAISKERNLVLQSASDVAGLHKSPPSAWPENLVLRLFQNVKPNAVRDEATANWVNAFLDSLCERAPLSPAVYDCVCDLALLTVTDVRTKSVRRVSAREWTRLSEGGDLFADGNDSRQWLRLLCDALPAWSGSVTSMLTPRWFSSSQIPYCSNHNAAAVVLRQETLGRFQDRLALVSRFAQTPLSDEVCLAMRFLMHTDASNSRAVDSLFLPSTQQNEQIWSRVINQLLEAGGGANTWRLLDSEWSSGLSPLLQNQLKVSTINAAGTVKELSTGQVDADVLRFPPDEWSSTDVSALLKGLFEAGQVNRSTTLCLLRRLCLHSQRGQAGERVAIAGGQDGRLGELFVLDKLGFEDGLPWDLRPLWQRFLSETKIIVRLPDNDLASTVQRYLFEQSGADGSTFSAELDWNYVVRRCLADDDPQEWAPLIMEALSHGDQAASGIGQLLKKTAWLPLSLGGRIAPKDLVVLEGLEDEVHSLLDPAKDGLAGVRALPAWVTEHNGFATLRKYFPNIEEALQFLGLWLHDKPKWHLGLSCVFQLPELATLLSEIVDIEILPAASLLTRLRSIRLRGREDSIDPLLRDHILPAVFQRFDYAQGGREKLETILHRLEGRDNRSAFNAYLAQGCSDGQLDGMLSRLQLVNQRGAWLPAHQLIWPSTNLDPSRQLCSEHAAILAPRYRDARVGIAVQVLPDQQAALGSGRFRLQQEPDFEEEVSNLKAYLQPFRNGNIGENLPAALVAVLGGHPQTLSLLREMLQGLGQRPEDFLAFLLGEKDSELAPRMRSARFLIEIVKGGTIEARTITGETITVALTQEISTLIVGDPAELWWTYSYNDRRETDCHRLRLRWIENPDQLQDAVSIFSSTIETILLKAHCNSVAAQCPAHIKEVLSKVADSGQSDLRRSQAYLLDMAEARLKEMGVKGIPGLDSVLQKFKDARQARVDAEMFESRTDTLAKQRRDEASKLVAAAKQELVDLLNDTGNGNACRALVEAVRRKMTDFQYSDMSVPLELFQNADDATAELEEMQQGTDGLVHRFVIESDRQERTLEVLHWGRPINRYEYPGFSSGLKRGYDQDLLKMLTLNFSDKGVLPGDGPAIVTGRFGLGFKSVFFVSEEPQVVSGRLAFEIRGGFFPVPLSQAAAESLRSKARVHAPANAVPTAIKLKGSPGTEDMISLTVEAFIRYAPLLTIFSRKMRTVVAKQDGAAPMIWTNMESGLTEGGLVMCAQVGGSNSYLCFRCALAVDQRPAVVLFQLNASGISELAQELTGLWITTPTFERSELKWAVNAPFKPDAGRQRLALNNDENRQIAEEVAAKWGAALLELFDETSMRWSQFADRAGLHTDANFTTWWRQIWKATTRGKPLLRWESIQHGGQVLNWIAWDRTVGAMRRLVQQRAAIPSNLPGAYSKMVSARDIRFSLSGLLGKAENGCFAEVSKWESMQKAFPPGQVVHAEVGVFLREAELGGSIPSITLEQVLATEIGPQRQVDFSVGERVGALFKNCKSLFESGTPDAPEVQHMLSWLNDISLMGRDETYHPVDELLSGRELGGLIDADEPLRAAFAPDATVLSERYTNVALGLFVRARGQLIANAATMAGWAKEASAQKLLAVFAYLVRGELGQQLADKLGRPWLDSNKNTPAWIGLSAEDQNEVERKFAKGHFWTPPIHPVVPPTQIEVQQVMDAEEAFSLISAWWRKEKGKWVSRYEQKTYPSGFLGSLPWPSEDAWDAETEPTAQRRWLMLFIHASLVSLGFNTIGRDQSFSRFLVDKKWLDVLAKASESPEDLLPALDQYLNGFVENTQFHFQMRQFIAFYAVAKNLETFLISLREAERADDATAFRMVFAPNANALFTGTGITAPPLKSMLGIGSCHLLRELYRVGRMTNPLGYPFAFTPIRKVRRLCRQLFGTPEGLTSNEAFQVLLDLGKRLDMDPTFDRCFDLPFQFLAEEDALRVRVLNKEFEVESGDDNTLDAAPDQEQLS